jgi:hypothetical protein
VNYERDTTQTHAGNETERVVDFDPTGGPGEEDYNAHEVLSHHLIGGGKPMQPTYDDPSIYQTSYVPQPNQHVTMAMQYSDLHGPSISVSDMTYTQPNVFPTPPSQPLQPSESPEPWNPENYPDISDALGSLKIDEAGNGKDSQTNHL